MRPRPVPGTTLAPITPSTSKPSEAGILETVWRIVRRRWLIVLATVLITALLAVGFSMSQVEQYTATASLLFGRSPTTS